MLVLVRFRLLASLMMCCAVVLLTATQPRAQYYNNTYQSNYRGNVFRQEVARLDITVERPGKLPLPIKMVPSVKAGDLIRVRMLDQVINGIRPNESRWDWTLAVAYVNPNRKNSHRESVSREINFRRDGWYREHAFKVPYESQPIFFLYPKQKYRNQIRKLINKNFDQVRKIGEKTLELSNAYAQIGSFLTELQQVIERDSYGYGGYNRGYGNYEYGGYGDRYRNLKEEVVERLAQSFRINLPDCWRGGSSYGINSNRYSNDFTSRAQCVAQNVRLEDFDLSVAQIIKQGGLFAVPKLIKKYPELAEWIGIAAVAVDLILKLTNKTQLRIFPTMAGQSFGYGSTYRNSYTQNGYRPTNRSSTVPSQPISVYSSQPPTDSNFVSAFPIVVHKSQPQINPEAVRIPAPKLFERCLHIGRNILKNTDLTYDWLRDPFARDFKLVMSSTNGFTKEFPLTKNVGVSGWEFTINPKDLSSMPPIKMKLEGQIIAIRGFDEIKSKRFKIPISVSGSSQQKSQFRSSYRFKGSSEQPQNNVPKPKGWQINEQSKNAFSVGGSRRIVITNPNGDCLCLNQIKYKPSFGGEFTFRVNASANPLQISDDGSFAWFELDTTEFKPGKGTLEISTLDSVKPNTIPIKLHPPPPEITRLVAHKGDRFIRLEGKWLEQISSISVNGKLAQVDVSRRQKSGRVFVFQSPNDLVISNKVKVSLHLVSNRKFQYLRSFQVLPSRPILKANKELEITADAIGGAHSIKLSGADIDLNSYPIVSVDVEKMTLVVEANLTDYNFRAENISIETRVENGEVSKPNLPQATFEVIDPVTLRLSFVFDSSYKQFLAARRLQFRILDRQRGASDWYTIKQTFTRIPEIVSVACHSKRCSIIGSGLDYIGKYSVDGGNTWRRPVAAKARSDGKFVLEFTGVTNRKMLRIKLRDYEGTEGFVIF